VVSIKRGVLKAMYLSMGVMFTFFFSCFLAQDIEAAPFAYITNSGSNNVSVIDIATDTVVATVPVGTAPDGVSVNPGGTMAYITNAVSNNVSVIDTATNTVVATVVVGTAPIGVSVNPAGTRVYVANLNSNTVSVIDTATDTVVATVTVGTNPFAYGQFIGGPAPASVVAAVPAMNVWGMIIFMVFAGSICVYFIRRQKRA